MSFFAASLIYVPILFWVWFFTARRKLSKDTLSRIKNISATLVALGIINIMTKSIVHELGVVGLFLGRYTSPAFGAFVSLYLDLWLVNALVAYLAHKQIHNPARSSSLSWKEKLPLRRRAMWGFVREEEEDDKSKEANEIMRARGSIKEQKKEEGSVKV